jgi:Flp pilus assembly protein TadG
MMRNSRDATSEQGSTLVEFALVSTLLCTLMFGIMEFGHAMYAYHFISNAAREATRYASVRGSTFAGTACSNPPPVAYSCEAQGGASGDITAYVNSIVAPGIYVNKNASSGTAGYLGVSTKWNPSGAPGTCPATPSGGENPGCFVQIQVTYTYGFTLPFVSKDVSSITMTSTSETMIQQ